MASVEGLSSVNLRLVNMKGVNTNGFDQLRSEMH